MYYMRPQVMAQVVPQEQRRMRERGPMNMRDAPTAPDAVRFDVIPDVEALKDSPAPLFEGPAPGVEGFEQGDTMPSAAAPELAAAGLAVPIPPAENAPPLSERFSAQSGDDVSATPVSPVSMAAAAAASIASVMSGDGDAPSVADAAPAPREETSRQEAEALMPKFEPPSPPSLADALPDPSLAAAGLPPEKVDVPSAPSSGAAIPVEVMAKVDERVVEEEKAAVRELLDARNASELENVVEVSARSAQSDGWVYFSVRLKPGAELATVPKDVVVLLDASASIGRDRLSSCREAARGILRSCTNTGDRFNLVAFRDRFSYAFKSWQDCSRDSFEKADAWLDRLVAHGRTDVFATIRSVLTLPRDPSRALIAVVVTDGDANAGISETAQILSRFTALNDGLVSVYMYGVKGSANRELLDVLTHGNRGESFIYDGERALAGSELQTLAARFRDPVLSDLRVIFASGSAAEAYPRRLRNLYRGEDVTIYGRAPSGTKEVSFSIRGLNGASPYEGFFTVPLAGDGIFDPALPGEWMKERAIDAKLRWER